MRRLAKLLVSRQTHICRSCLFATRREFSSDQYIFTRLFKHSHIEFHFNTAPIVTSNQRNAHKCNCTIVH